MAYDDPGRIQQWNATVALHAPFAEKRWVGGEKLAKAFRTMRELSIQDRLTRSAGERDLEIFHETPASPNGARSKMEPIA